MERAISAVCHKQLKKSVESAETISKDAWGRHRVTHHAWLNGNSDVADKSGNGGARSQ